MTQRITGILIALVGVVLTTSASVETGLQVRLNVTAESELSEELVRCLEERLGASPEVELEADAHVQLRLIALEQKSTDGAVFGYLVYQAGLVTAQDPAAFHVLWETLRSLPPDLPAACDRLASSYRTEVIAPLRDGIESFRKQLRARAPSG